jgi:hypothetical protein
MAKLSITARLTALRAGILNHNRLFHGSISSAASAPNLRSDWHCGLRTAHRMAKLALIRFHRMAGSALIWVNPAGGGCGSLVGRVISDADLTSIKPPFRPAANLNRQQLGGGDTPMATMMKAAIVHAFGKPLQIKEVPIPAPGPGEIPIKVTATGRATPSSTRPTAISQSRSVPPSRPRPVAAAHFNLRQSRLTKSGACWA